MNSFNKVYLQVKKIPKGKVATYKQLSELLGISARVVGFALHANKNPKETPCHRVVNIKGELAKGYAFGGKTKQREKLEEEGIRFLENGSIDLNVFQHLFNTA